MDQSAVNSAIDETALKGRLTAQDLERWRKADTPGSGTAPLWLSVLLGMSSSLDVTPDQVNAILQAAMPRGEKLAKRNPSDEILIEIDPSVIMELSFAADAALKRGDSERAQALWLEVITTARELKMTPAEPYRLYGNLASTAFINGDTLLAEAALDIALHLNPNYSFGRTLQRQNEDGEFLSFSLKKIAALPPRKITTVSDLEMQSTDDIFKHLQAQGIVLNEAGFKALAAPIKDTIGKVVDQLLALVKDQEPDEDYVYAACEVLWDRLITRPIFETIEEILFGLEDCELDSSLYFDLVKKLAWAFDKADRGVFTHYQKYPYELAGLRYTLHDLLAFEVLRQSGVADAVLSIAESALKSGYFPDMMVHDVVRRIANGKDWQHQFKVLTEKHPEYSQVIAMGIARGLLEIGEYDKITGVCRQLAWDKVVNDTLPPDDLAIRSLSDCLVAAYEKLGDKRGVKQVEKEKAGIERKLDEVAEAESQTLKANANASSLAVLKKLGKYPELFSYHDFLLSLGLDFSTTVPTDDKLTSFSIRHEPKIGRNEPCPCGSGKKYKKCHGSEV